MNIEDLSGLKCNKLTVIKFSHRKQRRYYWECICECGNKTVSDGYRLKNGLITSCGCAINWAKLHGLSNSRIYNIWGNMMGRCHNPNNDRYYRYGGRGISVCVRWHTFKNFYEDLHGGYSDNLTLDRFPNQKGNYEPGNVRWATNLQQQRNKEGNILIDVNGERHIIKEWSEITGLSYETIRGRIRRGWESDFLIPKHPPQNKKLKCLNKKK